MSLTLGLNTALSGLLTNQRALDVIAQNVVNVSTIGYTRKVMNPESRVLAGHGAGVQDAGVTRMVNEGLLKDIRRQNANMGELQLQQQYYERIEQLFGQVADNTSIAHRVNEMQRAFQALSSNVSQPAAQMETIRTAQDVTDLLARMSEQLQDLRLEADGEIEQTVEKINEHLANIHYLNQNIVKNGAISTGTADLEDKRDLEISALSELIDVQYFARSDGSMMVYTNSGEMLIDNAPQQLAYFSSSVLGASTSSAAGEIGRIVVEGGSQDFDSSVTGGKLRALLDMRDTTLPNLQATLDELGITMKEAVNLAHNRGTSLPNVSHTYTGTRVFAAQGTIAYTTTENTATITSGTTTIAPAAYGNLTFSYNAAGEATISSTIAGLNLPVGSTFSIHNSEDANGDGVPGDNDGTYEVVSNPDNQNLVVRKSNPLQTFSLADGTDSAIVLFDTEGNQIAQTTVKNLMGMAFSATDPELTAKGPTDPWTLGMFNRHLEEWLQSQGYTDAANASVGLNSEGKLSISTGDTSVSLAFRDQASSTAGASAQDAVVKLDTDGDGSADQTVKGFSNFFGLNDFFVRTTENDIYESTIQPSGFTVPRDRTLRIYDATGQIGNEIVIGRGDSLQDVADQINARTRLTESAALNLTSYTLTSAATITVSDGSNNVYAPIPVPAGSVNLYDLAGQMSQNGVRAEVVQDGDKYRLRVTSATGKELSVSIAGGQLSGENVSLGGKLNMTAQARVTASVVPEGSGYRLRIAQSSHEELYLASDVDASGSFLTDIGLDIGATGIAGQLAVRSDLQAAPEKVSRGSVQWNADSNRYYLSEGDNSSASAMSAAMSAKRAMASSGLIAAGTYSLGDFAATAVASVAQDASNTQTTYDYQKTLSEAMDFQYSSLSGVNLDEEVAAMIDFQQAYSASARVISVLQEMLKELTDMIR